MSTPGFAGWVRETTFNLSLTQAAIVELLYIHRDQGELSPQRLRRYQGVEIGSRSLCAYLGRRGLIEPVSEMLGTYRLTEAGTLTARLLVLAGFQAEFGRCSSVDVQDVQRVADLDWMLD